MFTVDDEEKAKNKKKIIDEMIDSYQKKKDKYNEDSKKKQVKLDGKKVGGIGKNWVKNDTADNFLKCMLPTGLLIGTGGALWTCGFLVGEISKAATFLNGVSIPASVSGILLTSNFWIVVGCVAGLCLVLFGVVSLVSFLVKKNNKSLKEGKYKTKYKEKRKKKNKGKLQKKQHIKTQSTEINKAYGYGSSKDIKNTSRYNKNNYYINRKNIDYSDRQKNYFSNNKKSKHINSPPFLNKERKNYFEMGIKNNNYKKFNSSQEYDFSKQNNKYNGNAILKFNKKHYYTENSDKSKKIY